MPEDNTIANLARTYARRLSASAHDVRLMREELNWIGADIHTWHITCSGQPVNWDLRERILLATGRSMGLADPKLLVAAYRQAHTAALSASAYMSMVSEISKLSAELKAKKPAKPRTTKPPKRTFNAADLSRKR